MLHYSYLHSHRLPLTTSVGLPWALVCGTAYLWTKLFLDGLSNWCFLQTTPTPARSLSIISITASSVFPHTQIFHSCYTPQTARISRISVVCPGSFQSPTKTEPPPELFKCGTVGRRFLHFTVHSMHSNNFCSSASCFLRHIQYLSL